MGSLHVGSPLVFGYGPEVYELYPWGGVGDSRFNLDTDTYALNLLIQKLGDLCNGTSSKKASPSRGPFPAGSTAPQSTEPSPARSCSMTPFPWDQPSEVLLQLSIQCHLP